eukprot:11858-Heterococcus_DN1.PRE.5
MIVLSAQLRSITCSHRTYVGVCTATAQLEADHSTHSHYEACLCMTEVALFQPKLCSYCEHIICANYCSERFTGTSNMLIVQSTSAVNTALYTTQRTTAHTRANSVVPHVLSNVSRYGVKCTNTYDSAAADNLAACLP